MSLILTSDGDNGCTVLAMKAIKTVVSDGDDTGVILFTLTLVCTGNTATLCVDLKICVSIFLFYPTWLKLSSSLARFTKILDNL